MSIERELERLISEASPEGRLQRALDELTYQRVVSWLRGRRVQRLHQAVERMRMHRWHLWNVLRRLYLSPHADPSKLREWREAPEGSQEWRWAKQHDEALEILLAAVRD